MSGSVAKLLKRESRSYKTPGRRISILRNSSIHHRIVTSPARVGTPFFEVKPVLPLIKGIDEHNGMKLRD